MKATLFAVGCMASGAAHPSSPITHPPAAHAAHYHKSPDLISEEELRQYFLYLKNVKHYSRNTMTIAIWSQVLL